MHLEGTTETVDVVVPVGAVIGSVLAAFVVAAVVSAVVRSAARRSALALDLLERARRPMQVSLVVVAVYIALQMSTEEAPWRRPVDHVLLIGFILALAWLVAALAFVVEDLALARYDVDVPDNRHARRVRTQITVLRRVTVAVVALCALAAVLMTFPGARTAGASLIASAGVLSVVAGLAAQSSLANVFAGLQLAFTDAIRVDDVVVVEGEWGRIEEITMTYIVVHLWDDRRLILPSTYFTSTPFQNWTRRAADLLGTVELDLDWSVPVDEMRDELTRLLEASDLWDRRVGILQVTEATGGYVRVRALASAADAPTLFDLRCYVREELVDWLQRTQPQALPRARFEGSVLSGVADAPALPDLARDGDAPGRRSADRPESRPRARRPEPQPEAEPGRAHVPEPAAVPRHGPPASTAEEVLLAVHEPVTAPLSSVRPPEDDGPSDDAATVPVRRSARELGRRATDRVGSRALRVDRSADSRLFTGSMGAVERAQAFSGPGPDVISERERTAERDRPPLPDPVRDTAEGRRTGVPRDDGS